MQSLLPVRTTANDERWLLVLANHAQPALVLIRWPVDLPRRRQVSGGWCSVCVCVFLHCGEPAMELSPVAPEEHFLLWGWGVARS